MRRFLLVNILLTMLVLLQACVSPAVRKPTSTDDPVWQAETLVYEELLDPNQLTEPTWEIEDSALLLEMEVDPDRFETRQDSLVYGYRVQLAATRVLEEAQAIKQQALLLFGDEGVYYEYIPPLYRIRIGNCPDRRSAGRLLSRARGLGFSNAWIVQSLILLNPDN